MLGKIFAVVIALALLAFIVYECYGLVKSLISRRKRKLAEKNKKTEVNKDVDSGKFVDGPHE